MGTTGPKYQRAKAHAKRGYLCECGRVVHGNGARAMHFYIAGQRDAGYRPGHRQISAKRYAEIHACHPLDHPANA
jgi:hypothetical protein